MFALAMDWRAFFRVAVIAAATFFSVSFASVCLAGVVSTP
jgi:hypothetical protein